MKSIIEREATFENNSDMEVKLTLKQWLRAFVKETQWSKTYTYEKSIINKAATAAQKVFFASNEQFGFMEIRGFARTPTRYWNSPNNSMQMPRNSQLSWMRLAATNGALCSLDG